jgi:hypothetical protein
MRPGAHSSGRAPRGVGTAGAGHGGRHRFAALPDLYRRCVIRAVALVDPVAGEGFALGALYGPLAVVVWRDARGCRDARLLAPKHHVFRNETKRNGRGRDLDRAGEALRRHDARGHLHARRLTAGRGTLHPS